MHKSGGRLLKSIDLYITITEILFIQQAIALIKIMYIYSNNYFVIYVETNNDDLTVINFIGNLNAPNEQDIENIKNEIFESGKDFSLWDVMKENTELKIIGLYKLVRSTIEFFFQSNPIVPADSKFSQAYSNVQEIKLWDIVSERFLVFG